MSTFTELTTDQQLDGSRISYCFLAARALAQLGPRRLGESDTVSEVVIAQWRILFSRSDQPVLLPKYTGREKRSAGLGAGK